MGPTSSSSPPKTRVDERVRAWRIDVERITETETSVLAFGRRDSERVVLKVVKTPGDEWSAGGVVTAFDGRGVVRAYEWVDGAVLLERADPGHALATVSLNADDDGATQILAGVIRSMPSDAMVAGAPTVADWGRAFESYAAGGDTQISGSLVSKAHRVYAELCDSQSRVRLLHGDLHHHNVLFDAARGWLAIDPKGVVGELEYEVGAALRNPYERPSLFADPSTIRRRVDRFAAALDLDAARVLAWGFAQAVLSAIWSIEDGSPIDAGSGAIMLANALQPMLDS